MPSYGLGRRDEATFDYPVPSGNICRMRRADLTALIAGGVIDSIDMLTSLVHVEHVERVKKGKKTRHLQQQSGFEMTNEAKQALELMKDKKRWQELEGVVNGVVVQCVVEPKVLAIPAEEANPVPEGYKRPTPGDGKMYVDEVALVDRLAIFQEAMKGVLTGQQAMTPFREGSEAVVADLEPQQDLRQPAE